LFSKKKVLLKKTLTFSPGTYKPRFFQSFQTRAKARL
jgi:hypothetical protein